MNLIVNYKGSTKQNVKIGDVYTTSDGIGIMTNSKQFVLAYKKLVVETKLGTKAKTIADKVYTLKADTLIATLGQLIQDLGGTANIPLDDDSLAELNIHNLALLQAFAAAVNNGTTYGNKIVSLCADIDCSTWLNFNGIGIYNDSGKQFRGTFRGRNRTIRNLTIAGDNTRGVGFFKAIWQQPSDTWTVVKDLNFNNVVIQNPYKKSSVGVICGYCNGVSVQNCKVTDATVNGCYQLAGIAGQGYVLVINCTFEGLLHATGLWAVAGIIANLSSLNAAQPGGATGNTVNAKIYLLNIPAADIPGVTVGGVIGYATDKYATIKNNTVNCLTYVNGVKFNQYPVVGPYGSQFDSMTGVGIDNTNKWTADTSTLTQQLLVWQDDAYQPHGTGLFISNAI